jgi:hypothetical protein
MLGEQPITKRNNTPKCLYIDVRAFKAVQSNRRLHARKMDAAKHSALRRTWFGTLACIIPSTSVISVTRVLAERDIYQNTFWLDTRESGSPVSSAFENSLAYGRAPRTRTDGGARKGLLNIKVTIEKRPC